MKKTLISLAVASAISTTLFADANIDELKQELKALTKRLEEMEKKNNATQQMTDSLVQEVADSKIADSFGEYSGETYAGMAPGASKVYTNKNKLSIGGYGKVDYQNRRDIAQSDTTDSYRAVLYFGYRFTDNIILNTEIEFEHGGSETEVEMLALDFLVNEYANFRVGTYVLPIGHVNVNHEPTLFHSVKRPDTEVNIIPSTWFENGAMIYGSKGNVDYKAGVVSGFDASKATKDGSLRKMRSLGQESAANDAGYFIRADYTPVDIVTLSGSYYFGQADQGKPEFQGVDVNLFEVHTNVKYKGLEVVALYAQHEIGDAQKVAAISGTGYATKTGKGYYVDAGYTIGEWTPFARYENQNKFDEALDAAGNHVDIADTQDIVFGINYKPHPQVVLKADYVFRDTDDGTQTGTQTKDDRFELGMGFVF